LFIDNMQELGEGSGVSPGFWAICEVG